MDGQLRKRSVRLALLGLVVLISFAGVYWLRDIFAPLILGFLIAYMLDPFADGLEACRLPRLAAVAVIFIVFTLVGATAISVGGLYAVRGVETAIARVVGEKELKDFPEEGDPVAGVHYRDDAPENGQYDPGYLELLNRSVVELKRDLLPKWVSEGFDEWLDQQRNELTHEEKKQGVVETLEGIKQWGQRSLSYTFKDDRERDDRSIAGSGRDVEDEGPGLIAFFSYVLLLPIYVFFFLLEIDAIVAAVKRHLPKERKPQVVRIFHRIDLTLAAFFRGRLTVCLIKGVITAVALFLFDVPFGIPIGLAAGFLSLLPYVGIHLSLIPALLLSWFEAGSLGTLIGIVVFYGALEAFEGFVLIPKLLGAEVGLHPLTVIVTLLIFGKIFGLVGILLSVPLAAIAKILAAEFVLPLIQSLAGIETDTEPLDEPST